MRVLLFLACIFVCLVSVMGDYDCSSCTTRNFGYICASSCTDYMSYNGATDTCTCSKTGAACIYCGDSTATGSSVSSSSSSSSSSSGSSGSPSPPGYTYDMELATCTSTKSNDPALSTNPMQLFSETIYSVSDTYIAAIYTLDKNGNKFCVQAPSSGLGGTLQLAPCDPTNTAQIWLKGTDCCYGSEYFLKSNPTYAIQPYSTSSSLPVLETRVVYTDSSSCCTNSNNKGSIQGWGGYCIGSGSSTQCNWANRVTGLCWKAPSDLYLRFLASTGATGQAAGGSISSSSPTGSATSLGSKLTFGWGVLFSVIIFASIV